MDPLGSSDRATARTALVAQAGRVCVTVRRSRVARGARVAQRAPIPVTPASRASDQPPGRAVPAARAVWSVNLVATETTPWMERRAQRGPAAHRSATWAGLANSWRLD